VTSKTKTLRNTTNRNNRAVRDKAMPFGQVVVTITDLSSEAPDGAAAAIAGPVREHPARSNPVNQPSTVPTPLRAAGTP
jgi:hypothetical protein